MGIDLIVQYNLGVDLFGFEQSEHLGNRRHSGFFGDELILGNYQLVEKHLCIFLEIKQKLNGDQKGKHRPVMHRPFAGLAEIMKK